MQICFFLQTFWLIIKPFHWTRGVWFKHESSLMTQTSVNTNIKPIPRPKYHLHNRKMSFIYTTWHVKSNYLHNITVALVCVCVCVCVSQLSAVAAILLFLSVILGSFMFWFGAIQHSSVVSKRVCGYMSMSHYFCHRPKFLPVRESRVSVSSGSQFNYCRQM